jgi:protein gp37
MSMYNWPENAWAGVSVENRKNLVRLDPLKWCNAKMRFISFEPLLGPIGDIDLSGIHWIIVGGESGSRRREMDMIWVRELRDQAEEAGIPFFFKQDSGQRAGERPWIVEEDGTRTTIQEFPEYRSGIYQPAMFDGEE